MYFLTKEVLLHCTTAFTIVMLKNYINTAGAVLRDITHRLYQGVLYCQNVMDLYYTFKCNFMGVSKKLRPYLRRFSRKSLSAQQHYVLTSYTEFDSN
jgi:hypothetical protein